MIGLSIMWILYVLIVVLLFKVSQDWAKIVLVQLSLMVVFGLFSLFFLENRAIKKRKKFFIQRTPLPRDEFYKTFYDNPEISKNNIDFLITELATILKIPKEKLRVTDTFDKELTPYSFWEVDYNLYEKLNDLIYKRFITLGIKPDEVSINTLVDYIRIFGKYDISLLKHS